MKSNRQQRIEQLQTGFQTGTVTPQRFGEQIARASQRGKPSRIRAKMRKLTDKYKAGGFTAAEFARLYAAQKAKLDALSKA